MPDRAVRPNLLLPEYVAPTPPRRTYFPSRGGLDSPLYTCELCEQGGHERYDHCRIRAAELLKSGLFDMWGGLMAAPLFIPQVKFYFWWALLLKYFSLHRKVAFNVP